MLFEIAKLLVLTSRAVPPGPSQRELLFSRLDLNGAAANGAAARRVRRVILGPVSSMPSFTFAFHVFVIESFRLVTSFVRARRRGGKPRRSIFGKNSERISRTGTRSPTSACRVLAAIRA